jgi:hypothetical protein
VTVISTVAAAFGGDTAVLDVEELTTNDAAAVVPKLTPVAPVKLVPVIVMVSPPAVVPEVGLTAVTVGAEALLTVKWSAETAGELPLGVATMMSTVAAAWGGETAVIDVLELTVNDAAGTPPKLTPVAPVKFVPVMVVLVPPAVVPLDVPRDEIAGAVAAEMAYWSPLEGADVPA